MTTIIDVWEAHREELCEKVVELGEALIQKLVIILGKEQLIDQNVTDIVVQMSEQETVEMVVQSVGSKIASDPTALSNFLNIIKTFQGIQPLAETIEGKVSLVGSLMIPGMLQHMPKGKGTPALSALPPMIGVSSHDTGSPTHQDIQSDHPNATFSSNTQSQNIESRKIHTKTNPQRIDSGIIHDLSKSSDLEATNLDSTKESPPVQRSQSGASDSSSDSSLLSEVPSPVRKKFQEMKVKSSESLRLKRELEQENATLIEKLKEMSAEIHQLKNNERRLKEIGIERLDNEGLRHEKQTMSITETHVSNQPLAEHLPPQYTGNMEVGTEPQDETNNGITLHSDVEQEFTTTRTTFVSQEDIPVEFLDNVPPEVREYIQKLKQEREFLMQKTTETEVERNTLQVQLRSTQTLITNICLFYDRKIHELFLKYIKSFRRCQELERQIAIATNPGMQSLHLRMGLEQENATLIEKVKEMEAEIHQLKNNERGLQDLEQQKEEIVSVAVQKYVLPSALSEGPHEFEDVFAYYLARNNCVLKGTKCKVCSQHLGANQSYCQTCLPAKVNQKDHHKLQIDHKFQMLKTADSHIYSESVLVAACGGNNEDILRGYLSIPKFITPHACHWDLPECTKCDSSTSNLEKEFKQRYEAEYYCHRDGLESLVDSDAVLFYIYIHRGLAVNVDLMHYLLCSSCSRHVPGIWNVLQLAWKFRRTILQNHHKDVRDMAREAKANLLFHTIQEFPDAEHYLIEFPFLCDVKLPRVESCALVYAQIPPCCWAVPLDPSPPTLSELRTNFPAVVGEINKILSEKRKEYLKSIEMADTFPKLIIRYLLKCCFKVSLVSDTEVVADHD